MSRYNLIIKKASREETSFTSWWMCLWSADLLTLYWLLLTSTCCYWLSTDCLLTYIEFYWLSSDFHWHLLTFYWFSTDFCWLLLTFYLFFSSLHCTSLYTAHCTAASLCSGPGTALHWLTDQLSRLLFHLIISIWEKIVDNFIPFSAALQCLLRKQSVEIYYLSKPLASDKTICFPIIWGKL